MKQGNSGWPRSALLLAVLAGAVLRFFALEWQSLWVDETGTLLNVCWPSVSIAHFAAHANNSPPLYYWCVRPFVALFGPGEIGVRFLSACCGVLTIPVFHSLAFRLTGNRKVAIWAAWLLAASPLHLWFSQEARSYAFFLLLVLLSCRLYLRTMDAGRLIDWLWLSLVVFSAAFTHLLAPVILLIFWGWFVADQKRPRRGFVPLAILTVSSGLFWLGLVLYIRQVCQVAPPVRPFSGAEFFYTFFTFIAGFSYGPAVRELQQAGAAVAIMGNLPQTIIVLLILAGFGMYAVRNFSRDQWPVYSLILIPVGFAAAIALATHHTYNVRFVLPAYAGFLILLALLLQKMPRNFAMALSALLLGVSLWADLQWFACPRYGKDDTRAALQSVYNIRPDARKIMIAPAYMEDNLYYYLFQGGRTAQVVAVQSVDAVPENADADALLIARPQHVSDPGKIAAQFVSSNRARGIEEHSVPGFRVYVARHPAPAMSRNPPPKKKYGYFPGDSSTCFPQPQPNQQDFR